MKPDYKNWIPKGMLVSLIAGTVLSLALLFVFGVFGIGVNGKLRIRSEEHTSELQSHSFPTRRSSDLAPAIDTDHFSLGIALCAGNGQRTAAAADVQSHAALRQRDMLRRAVNDLL